MLSVCYFSTIGEWNTDPDAAAAALTRLFASLHYGAAQLFDLTSFDKVCQNYRLGGGKTADDRCICVAL